MAARYGCRPSAFLAIDNPILAFSVDLACYQEHLLDEPQYSDDGKTVWTWRQKIEKTGAVDPIAPEEFEELAKIARSS